MAITINGDTGLTLPASSSITGSSTTITGITSVASNATNTPVILQDSSSNSATCRAWVNFNGSGTPAIRADFNVTDITDNGTGNYDINFTNALPDADYAMTGTIRTNATTSTGSIMVYPNATPTVNSIQVYTSNCAASSQSASDPAYVYAAFFR